MEEKIDSVADNQPTSKKVNSVKKKDNIDGLHCQQISGATIQQENGASLQPVSGDSPKQGTGQEDIVGDIADCGQKFHKGEVAHQREVNEVITDHLEKESGDGLSNNVDDPRLAKSHGKKIKLNGVQLIAWFLFVRRENARGESTTS